MPGHSGSDLESDQALEAVYSLAMLTKATAVIARSGESGPEVCVFQHPSAGIQLPAGTLLAHEEPMDGCLREGFEETGLERLHPIARPAILDGYRAVVPFAFEGDAADEWWVFTPDGGGLCWRCFWLPLSRAEALNPLQRPWLEAVAPILVDAALPDARRRAVRDPDVETDLTIEVFWAPPFAGDRAQISWIEPHVAIADDEIRRSEVVAFTEDGLIVAQAERDPPPYGLPGGRRESGERPEETLRRELWEEACAEIVEFELIGYQRFRYVRDDATSPGTTDAMYWARARCEEFVPRFETKVRALRTTEEMRAERLFAQPLTQRLLDRAEAAEARYLAVDAAER